MGCAEVILFLEIGLVEQIVPQTTLPIIKREEEREAEKDTIGKCGEK